MLNENKGDEIIEILKHLYQYIPQEEVENIYISDMDAYRKKHTAYHALYTFTDLSTHITTQA